MVDDLASIDMARLVGEHHQAVYRYAYRLTGSVADAEDLTQQAFLTMQQKLGQLRAAECVRSWLFSILRNCFLKSCQKRRPTPAGGIALNIENIPAEPPAGDWVDRERLQRALDELPEMFRLVIGMFYYEDCSYKEIAEKLDLPIGTVMSRLARGKSQLRSLLFESESATGHRQSERTAPWRG